MTSKREIKGNVENPDQSFERVKNSDFVEKDHKQISNYQLWRHNKVY